MIRISGGEAMRTSRRPYAVSIASLPDPDDLETAGTAVADRVESEASGDTMNGALGVVVGRTDETCPPLLRALQMACDTRATPAMPTVISSVLTKTAGSALPRAVNREYMTVSFPETAS